MPLGSAQLGDEKFTLAGVDYHFRFPERGGALGLSSNSPFAPKSTSGERSYQDYDPFSATALADLSGGMGQERLIDVTRYLTAIDADARSGRIVLGPLQTDRHNLGPNISISTDQALPPATVSTAAACSWYTAYIVAGQVVTDPRAIAQLLTIATSTTLERIWIPVRLDASYAGDSIDLTVIVSSSSSPTGATVGSVSVPTSSVSTIGGWTEFIFTAPITLAAGDYWIRLAPSSIFTAFSWLGEEELVGTSANVMYYNSSSAWVASAAYAKMMLWYEPIATYPDRPVKFFSGAGKDNVKRTWLWAGHYLYYLSGITPTVASKRNTAPITDMAVPGTVTTSKQAGGSCKAGVYKLKVAARNAIGSTAATTGSNVTTEGKNLTVRAAFAAVTGATHYDIYCSTDADPLLVGSITEAQRATGIKISAVGVTSAGGTTGAVDIEVVGTGAVAAAAGLTVPGTVTTTKQAGGSCTAGTYKIKVAAGNLLGNTPATAGADVTTETTNLTVRVAFAAVTDATYYDIYCSEDDDPLLVGRITETQRASGIKLTAVGVTASGSTAGAVDVEVPGTGAVAAVAGTSSKRLTGDISAAVFFSGSSDGEVSYIYVAQSTVAGLEKYDADLNAGISGNGWATVAGEPRAELLAVHDNKLWRSLDRNEISASLDGATWGTAVEVGDKTCPIRNLLPWNGDLYVGKDDGLYKIEYATGYPTSGEPTSVRVVNLTAQQDDTNFRLLAEHQNDLWFSVGQGLMKLTSGDVLTSVAPELDLGYNQATRTSYTAAYSALTTLWVTAEANIDGSAPTTTDVSAASYVLAYFEGKWHPVAALARPGDMTRSIIIDTGVRDGIPRLWYGAGLGLAMVQMPTTTQRRWTWDGITFAANGILYTSWLDGNLRTIEKDWVQVEVDCLNATATNCVNVWWRATENSLWALVGTVTTDGISRLAFPASSHSAKCQLGIELQRGSTTTDTPHVLAVIVKYLERPRDARAFTRTYELSTHANWRTGAPVRLSLAEQLAQLETLRESAEPLTWTAWWGGTYTVHITQYSGGEQRERMTDLQDTGSIVVTLALQEVA